MHIMKQEAELIEEIARVTCSASNSIATASPKTN